MEIRGRQPHLSIIINIWSASPSQRASRPGTPTLLNTPTRRQTCQLWPRPRGSCTPLGLVHGHRGSPSSSARPCRCRGNRALVLGVRLVRREAPAPPLAPAPPGGRRGPPDVAERDVRVVVAAWEGRRRRPAGGPQGVEHQAEREQRRQRDHDGGPGSPEEANETITATPQRSKVSVSPDPGTYSDRRGPSVRPSSRHTLNICLATHWPAVEGHTQVRGFTPMPRPWPRPPRK